MPDLPHTERRNFFCCCKQSINGFFEGIDRNRIAEEAEYFGLDSLLHLLRIREEESDKEKEQRRGKAKKVIVYSLKHLRVTECLLVRLFSSRYLQPWKTKY